MAKKWEQWEIDYLKNNYSEISSSEIADKLDRNIDSVQLKASRLGIKKFKEAKKDGYSICKKCKRELPRTSQFFAVDKGCKDGLRSVCRECGKDGHFMSEGYIPSVKWSKEENDLFISRYINYTSAELVNLFYPNFTEKQLWDRADRLRRRFGIKLIKTLETQNRANKSKSIKISGSLTGRTLSKEHCRKISENKKEYFKTHTSHWKGRILTDEERKIISDRMKGKWSGKKNPRHKNPLYGDKNGRWKGGVKETYAFLRDNISEWKTDSIKSSDFKCIITDKSFDEIHHLYPFRDIVKEMFVELNIKIKQTISEYSRQELLDMIKYINDIHYNYGLGICITKDIHKKFHDIYGYTNFMPSDFYEFALKYYNKDLKKLNLKGVSFDDK